MSSPAAGTPVRTSKERNISSPAPCHWLVEAADTWQDDKLVSLLKAHPFTVKAASPLSKIKGDSSRRPGPTDPIVVDDNTLTETLFRCISADKPLAARILAQKKGVRLQNKYGRDQRTVLHMAAAAPESMGKVLRELLHRPDAARHVDQPDHVGRTALHEAATRAAPDAVLDDLLAAGANIDAVDEQFLTPLQSFIIGTCRPGPITGTCRPGVDSRTARFLIKRGGAEVNTKNILGDSPLHDAASHDNEPLMRLLLRYGADPDSVNADRKTPQALLPEGSAAKRIFLEPCAKWKPRNATKTPTQAPLCTGDRKRVCESFYITVRFYYRPRSLSWSQTSTVYSVIYDNRTIPRFEDQFIEIIRDTVSSTTKGKGKAREDKPGLHPSTTLHQDPGKSRDVPFQVRREDTWKWIHLPANNMTWVKDLIYCLMFSPQTSTHLKRALQFVDHHIKEHKDNQGCSRLPHVEEERREDGAGVGDDGGSGKDDGDDTADDTPVSPEIPSSASATSGLGINQHHTSPDHLPGTTNPLPSPTKSLRSPKTTKTSKASHSRFRRGGEAWRSLTAPRENRRRLSLVIPYVDFETELYLEKESASMARLHSLDASVAEGEERQPDRTAALERHYPPFLGPWGLQLPRTLDESYYHMLGDDELRACNTDQVIYKWLDDAAVCGSSRPKTSRQDAEDGDEQDLDGVATAEDSDDSPPQNSVGHQTDHDSASDSEDDNGTAAGTERGSTTNRNESPDKGRREGAKPVIDPDDVNKRQRVTRTDQRKLLMVHQLWLWKPDENTVITSHPERWHTGIEHMLLETIRRSGINEFQEPEDLIEHILLGCVRFPEKYQYAGLGRHILDVFENAIAIRSHHDVKCFKRFVSQLEDDPRSQPESSAAAAKEHGKADKGSSNRDKVNITEEITLIYEIKDIRDELHLLDRIFKEQADTVERFAQLFWPDVEKDEKLRQQFLHDCGIQDLRERIEKLDGDAKRTLEDLDYLVEVKQARSSLKEAEAAGHLSSMTVKQGIRSQWLNNFILLFTVVTVIFTPLSFMTSLFAIPIDGFPQDEANGNVSYEAGWFASRIIAGELATLAFIALLAIYCFKTPDQPRQGQTLIQDFSLARRGDSVAVQSHKSDRPALSIHGAEGGADKRASISSSFDDSHHQPDPPPPVLATTPSGGLLPSTSIFPVRPPTKWERIRGIAHQWADIERQLELRVDVKMWSRGVPEEDSELPSPRQ